jgi:MOSC domain-containing protein YiiM
MALIHQINISDGGVPKLPVDRAAVALDGMEGDRQADRKHHGGPDQTLCLYSLEVIEMLRAEGHPIAPGSAGENLTISGLDWATVAPEQRFRIGADLTIEITDVATPCAKNAQWFADGRFSRMSDTRHPGSSRWYARVLTPGSVTTGDPVIQITP